MHKRSIDDFGMAGDTPAFGPMSSTVSGADIGPALTDLGGPLLSKQAAMQFELMSKRAQAEILSDPDVPATVKLALAVHHTRLTKEAKFKLVKHVYSKMASHEKQALIGKMLGGAGKMLGSAWKAVKPGFGNSAALRGQLRALGGVQNVQHNLGAMGQFARQGVPLKNLMQQGGHGLGHFPTMMRPGDMLDDAAGAVGSAASSLGKTTGGMPAASTAKGMNSMAETTDFTPGPRPARPAVDPHSVLSDPDNLDQADLTSIASGSRPSMGTASQSRATQLSPSGLVPSFGDADQSALTQLGARQPGQQIMQLGADDSALTFGQGW